MELVGEREAESFCSGDDGDDDDSRTDTEPCTVVRETDL